MSVLLSEAEEERFTAYCREKGFKKSTLVARLIREHLNREGYANQQTLALDDGADARGRPTSGRRE
jgi:hypothetical protein